MPDSADVEQGDRRKTASTIDGTLMVLALLFVVVGNACAEGKCTTTHTHTYTQRYAQTGPSLFSPSLQSSKTEEADSLSSTKNHDLINLCLVLFLCCPCSSFPKQTEILHDLPLLMRHPNQLLTHHSKRASCCCSHNPPDGRQEAASRNVARKK